MVPCRPPETWSDLFTAIRGARVLGSADASAYLTGYVRRELAPKYSSWENFDAGLPENIRA